MARIVHAAAARLQVQADSDLERGFDAVAPAVLQRARLQVVEARYGDEIARAGLIGIFLTQSEPIAYEGVGDEYWSLVNQALID